MVRCENCETNHEGTFGSGRFCSLKCSRAFSTKAKRKEINKKVAEKLLSKNISKIPMRNFTCKKCAKNYTRRSLNSSFCSQKCKSNTSLISEKARESMSIAASNRVLNNFAHCNYYTVFSGGKEIRVQGSWERDVALRLNELDIIFERKFIRYEKHHRYTPDFYIPEKNVYIEVKGWWSERDISKMNRVCKENNIDIILIDSLHTKKKFCNGNLKFEELKLWPCRSMDRTTAF